MSFVPSAAVLHVAAVNLKFDAASTDICILAPPSSTRLLKASNAVNTISRASPAVHDDRPLPAAVNDFAAGGPKLTEILNGVEHANFFESRATEYSKVATSGSWDGKSGVWAVFDKKIMSF